MRALRDDQRSKPLREAAQSNKSSFVEGSKHTPGPWTVLKTDTLFTVWSDDRVQVSQTSWHGLIRTPYPLKTEAEANARLIAAAPEMLEALTYLVAHCKGLDRFEGNPINEAIRAARAAIAKAEGRANLADATQKAPHP